MSYQKLADLALKLHQRTVAGALDWEETVKKGVYQSVFSQYSIRISKSPSRVEPDEDDYKIEVFDMDGNILEAYTDLELKDFDTPSTNKTYYHYMREIYETARRTALGSEKAINSILSELNGEIPF